MDLFPSSSSDGPEEYGLIVALFLFSVLVGCSTCVMKYAAAAAPRADRTAVCSKITTSRECVICLSVVDEGVCLPCGHVYHRKCIARWFHRSWSCPVCRWHPPEWEAELAERARRVLDVYAVRQIMV